MIVYGQIIPPAAIRAGRASMRGEFSRDTVFEAVCAAGASWRTVAEVSRRLIRQAQDNGTIRPLSINRFESIAR